MAVSATPPMLSSTSSPSSGGLFRSDPLYASPTESSRLPSGMINTFINSGGGGGGGNGSSVTNDCKMVEVHGVKVASFNMDGQEMICLPQVFDLFLKHLVGGLHTVYTKLKRLDICPVVCTVEQVRILRGLGAIQPGVNRCKLITRKDFEALYSDCTNARVFPSLVPSAAYDRFQTPPATLTRISGWKMDSSRPGRPPKRSLGVSMQDSSRLLTHSMNGLLPPGLLPPTGLTAAAMAEAMKLQKMKLMAMNSLHGVANQNGTESENEELNSSAGGSESSWEKEKLQSPLTSGAQLGQSSSQLGPLPQNHLLTNRLDLPFMVMPHPLLPVSLPPASVAMAMSQMNHLSTMANMAAAAQMHGSLPKASTSVIKECVQDGLSPAPSMEEPPQRGSQPSSHPSSSASSSPVPSLQAPDRLLPAADLRDRDGGVIRNTVQEKAEDARLVLPMMKPGFDKQTLATGFPASFLFSDGLSSMETLLTNIQSLLKVAVENARIQEKQIQQERKELKMELFREREMRESLERQLTSELQIRATIQKRLKREKKAKRKLQEALEFESKRREQVEQALKRATSPNSLCASLSDPVLPELEPEHNESQQENSAGQENRVYMKTSVLY